MLNKSLSSATRVYAYSALGVVVGGALGILDIYAASKGWLMAGPLDQALAIGATICVILMLLISFISSWKLWAAGSLPTGGLVVWIIHTRMLDHHPLQAALFGTWILVWLIVTAGFARKANARKAA